MSALELRAGPKALAHIKSHGLRPADIAVIPAAAGGPKGLILQSLDQWLFGTWLPSAPRTRGLIGASIGAWRMAAACHADPVSAFKRLGDYYAEQRYPKDPSPELIRDMCRQLLADFMGGHEAEIVGNPRFRLHILAVRGLGLLSEPKRKNTVALGFAGAALSNTLGRKHLAKHLERVVIGDARDELAWVKNGFDEFTNRFVTLTQDNLAQALLSSGTLPMVMPPVAAIEGAPRGTYWDGGLTDYHVSFPYHRLHSETEPGLVLYPHFGPRIVPGWLDKAMPWRHGLPKTRGDWYDNVVLLSPSPAFLATLPRGKLLDRNDFHHYGLDHDARIRAWQQAIGQAQQLLDEFIAFVERPDIDKILPL
jgi:hypothetical protein